MIRQEDFTLVSMTSLYLVRNSITYFQNEYQEKFHQILSSENGNYRDLLLNTKLTFDELSQVILDEIKLYKSCKFSQINE